MCYNLELSMNILSVGWYELYSSGWGQALVADLCENGSETLGSIKSWEIPE
jgi:hypothetical protein